MKGVKQEIIGTIARADYGFGRSDRRLDVVLQLQGEGHSVQVNISVPEQVVEMLNAAGVFYISELVDKPVVIVVAAGEFAGWRFK